MRLIIAFLLCSLAACYQDPRLPSDGKMGDEIWLTKEFTRAAWVHSESDKFVRVAKEAKLCCHWQLRGYLHDDGDLSVSWEPTGLCVALGDKRCSL